MTSAPAKGLLKLEDPGTIRSSAHADLILFDPEGFVIRKGREHHLTLIRSRLAFVKGQPVLKQRQIQTPVLDG